PGLHQVLLRHRIHASRAIVVQAVEIPLGGHGTLLFIVIHSNTKHCSAKPSRIHFECAFSQHRRKHIPWQSTWRWIAALLARNNATDQPSTARIFSALAIQSEPIRYALNASSASSLSILEQMR